MNNKQPYSPYQKFYANDIKITNAVISLDTLLDKLDYKNISYNNYPIDYLWGEEKMSRLIESILLRIPLPPFYFDVSNPYIWILIDGVQRLYTIERFIINNDFVLRNMEVLTHLNNSKYSDLDNSYKRVLNDTQIITYQIEAQTPEHLREIIFKRIRDMNEN